MQFRNDANWQNGYTDFNSPNGGQLPGIIIGQPPATRLVNFSESMVSVSRTAQSATFKLCCNSGKVRIPLPEVPPEPLRTLWTSSNAIAHFRDNVRAYNNVFAFSFIGVTLDRALANSINVLIPFRIVGRASHRIGPMIPEQGQQPGFAQVHISTLLQTAELHARSSVYRWHPGKYAIIDSSPQPLSYRLYDECIPQYLP
ncbi:hypothetical protein VTP01DRAFT_8392 [Rhizomucor pusillus]|uniref:uncharacterized protein n=1 Tax=Rhizomucor pusillus TaxID=4840 RepID=UPI0037444D36